MFDFNLTLFRDSLNTPWGFRLEGGRDYGTPLTIQRVFAGSPAAADLQRGDIILAIQNRDANSLFHQEANDLIRNSGGSLHLSIRRGSTYSGAPTAAPSYSQYRPPTSLGFTAPQSPLSNLRSGAFQYYNEDPTSGYIRSRPIEKQKDPKPILSQTGSPIMPGETPHLTSHSSIKRYRPASTTPIFSSAHRLPTTQFSAPQHPQPVQQHHHHHQPLSINTNTTPTPFDRRMVNQIQGSLNRAATAHRPVHNPYTSSYSTLNLGPSGGPSYASPPTQRRPLTTQSNFISDFGGGVDSSSNPMWQQTLRRTGFDLFDEPSQQHQQQQQQQPQHQVQFQAQPIAYKPVNTTSSFQIGTFNKPAGSSSSGGGGVSPKSPKIVNLQYNTPIGLYSNNNIKEELHKQVGVSDVQFVPSSEF